MARRIIGVLIVSLFAAGLLAGGCAAQEELKQLVDGTITVSYPPGMESQAKKVMGIMKKSIEPSIDIHHQIVSLLANSGDISTQIAALLGSEEIQQTVTQRLDAYKTKSEALVQAFSNVRLIKTADGMATGGVDAGVLQVRYSQDKDKFNMALDLTGNTGDKLKRSYFPVFINGDGSIRSESKLVDMTVDMLGSSKALVVAPIHESVRYAVEERLNLYHPFARWFNEGVSGWVTKRVIGKIDPQTGDVADKVFAVSADAQKMRDKVNLIAWPQAAFQNQQKPFFDPSLEAAQVQYSVELVSGILGGNRSDKLARIVKSLKYNPADDSATICEAIKRETGDDPQPKLMAYVPKNVKDGIESGEPKKLVSQAEKLVQEKKWSQAADKLRLALQMTPEDVNARLNLAWVEREFGERLDSELQVFLTAGLLKLKPQHYAIHLFVSSVEGNYINGRLAILLGDLDSARRFLEPVLQLKPDHKDAKRAMEEVNKLEGAAKGT